ncbi:MAG: ABC-F family ATP-binding cassette domain-containing protein [Oscillospiraceae bacterium]|nr:ABC-F family ATP-binding cassette domain-containing protein [Oscillospiraceae bacterium]
MSQIKADMLTFGYEGSPENVFEDVCFTLDTDWKLGLIGRNGKGKTTLLRLLTGELKGRGVLTKSVPVAYFPYTLTREQMSLTGAEIAEDIRKDCEIWRVICELSELEEDAEILYRPFDTLSWGQRTKLLLAVLFSGENDFLLIDEPTNHLDGAARENVRRYLSEKKGFILVSHDRDLLDACTDHILVLNRSTISVQSGNFSLWQENKERQDRSAEAENEKHRRQITKLQKSAKRTSEWADRNESTKIGFDPVKEHDRCISARSYIGAKTKKLQSRAKNTQKRIEREIERQEGLLQDIEEIKSLKMAPLTHHKETVVDINGLTLRYSDAAAPVCRELRFDIKQGERVALDGANGCGKSTLMGAVLQKAGLAERDDSLVCEGTLQTASGLVISYVPQDTSDLRGSIKEFCMERGLDLSLFCTVLKYLDIGRERLSGDISDFSAGQKKKVLIGASLLTPAHLYIWDEPLNFVDIISRMQIEALINTFRPTMLFAEHDKRFRENIATKTVYMSR